MSDSGTLRKISINKIFYPASADTDLSRTSGEYATEGQPTTGAANMKLTRQVEIVEGIDLILDGADRENILDVITSRKDVDLGYETAEGSYYSASGRITITGDATQDAKISLTMIPRKSWTATTV